MAFEAGRRPEVASVQRAAEVSLRWFEQTERYLGLSPLQFTFSLLTRSLRVSHGNLKLRDPELVSEVDRFVAAEAQDRTGLTVPSDTPPMFTPLTIRGVTLMNRVGVSPMCQYSAQEGLIDDWHLVHLGSRAVGGAGLIVCEMTAISPEARITPGCAGLYSEAHEVAWRRVVEFTHRHSAALVGIQLGHAGRKGATDVPWRGERPLTEGAWPLVAASPIAYEAGSQVPREMSRAEMDQALEDYRAATRRAARAGFDLLEVHMAHGYLLASFISPLTNRRTDGYGGSIEARARFPLEVLRAVREAWPEERPLSVRISASDWYPEGISEAEVVCLAELLGQSGADIIDVSTGQTLPEARPVYGRLYQTPFSELIRLSSGLLTMTVGNISSFSDINSIIAGGRADVCLLARGHLFDPYFTQHAARAQGVEVSWPSQYASVANFRARAD
ncbi:MAG: oxidoreductase [Polyangiaceae bacterium]|nr:oxidoreductase [Polyangiaceae bacterium]MCW5792647.1 oxidoreductase [Polyangiaceae bacterium]